MAVTRYSYIGLGMGKTRTAEVSLGVKDIAKVLAKAIIPSTEIGMSVTSFRQHRVWKVANMMASSRTNHVFSGDRTSWVVVYSEAIAALHISTFNLDNRTSYA